MRVASSVFEAIAAHARQDSPRECCGILVGTDDEILEAVPAANVAAEPMRRYEVSPEDHFRQMKRCRESGRTGPSPLRIVGVYHSHPHSAAVPSPTDLEQAFEEYLYVIAGPCDGSAGTAVRAYRVKEGEFEEIELRRVRGERTWSGSGVNSDRDPLYAGPALPFSQMPDHFEFGGEVAWRPTPEYIDRSRLKAFLSRYGLPDYPALLQRSIDDPEWFWSAVLDDLGIEFYEPYTQLLDASRGPAWPDWCVGGRLNIVHNCIDKWIGTSTETKAVIRWEGEEGATRVLTYVELFGEVNRCAGLMRRLGVARGDRVALFMPMCPELVIAFFATIKLGGVVLPLFSGYGPEAVASRLRDAEATLLVTADGYLRRGQTINMKAVADEAVAGTPSVKHVLVVPRLGIHTAWTSGRDHAWSEVTRESGAFEAARTASSDPMMIIYTSGTTGRPKGALHTHCGFAIKAAQDMAHCFDAQATDTMYWVTDIGWMMGPWELFGMTLIGGTAVIYDGAMDYPGPDRLWSLVEHHGVTILGVSPTLIRALMRHGTEPVERHDLSSLRILGSTGEPWNPESWRWLFEHAGGTRLPIINYSGGTETSGGLVGGNVLTPMKPCAFAGPPPGIAADVVDETGRPVRNAVGELVVRAPWIGMTYGFWKDPERYEQTYWSRFPGVWVHGDWAAIDEDGLWYILGRSDDTIKVAGKRLGPAEVESVLVEHPAVLESAAIGVPDPTKGQALVCFCVLRPGHVPSDSLADELKALVTSRLGKPLRPQAVEFVPDLPKTRNAKVMRRVIRAAYAGEPAGDVSSLENPQAVEEIRKARR